MTGTELVTAALFMNESYGQGDTLQTADSTLALGCLNRMLDSWNNVRELCYEIFFDTLSLVSGTQSYASSSLGAGRPIRVETLFARQNNIDYPVELIGPDEWASLGYKPVQSIPSKCFIDWAYPDATLYFYPTPNGSYTLYVGVRRKLPATIVGATTLSLPPGYERALVCALAEETAPYFGRPIKPDLARLARAARTVLKRTNYEPLVMDYALGSSRIYTQADFNAGR